MTELPTSNQRPFQGRVVDWMMETFSMEVCRNTTERNHRFLEEALELVQAMGCTAAEAHMLVDYTFGRPVGDPEQEVGGALVTLAALCSAADISMAELGERELARCWQNIDRIRFKQAGKPRSSPLPGPSPVETQPVASNPDHERWLAETWKMIETCATDIRSSNVTLSPEGCRALLGERNAHETTADQPPKKADLSSELFAAWNALNELRRDAEEAEARAFKALDGYEVPPEEPSRIESGAPRGEAGDRAVPQISPLPRGFITVAQCASCCVQDFPGARHHSQCACGPGELVRPEKANCLCPPGGYYTGCPQHGNLKKAAEPLEKHPDYCMAHGGHLVDSPACKLAREREKRA